METQCWGDIPISSFLRDQDLLKQKGVAALRGVIGPTLHLLASPDGKWGHLTRLRRGSNPWRGQQTHVSLTVI